MITEKLDLAPEVPLLIDVWIKQTNNSLHELAMRDIAYILEQPADKSYWIIRLVKCRYPYSDIINWCNLQWGQQDYSRWKAYNANNWHGLTLTVRDYSDVSLWILTWSK